MHINHICGEAGKQYTVKKEATGCCERGLPVSHRLNLCHANPD